MWNDDMSKLEIAEIDTPKANEKSQILLVV